MGQAYGNYVLVRYSHADGTRHKWFSMLAHWIASRLGIKEGTREQPDSVLGRMGRIGKRLDETLEVTGVYDHHWAVKNGPHHKEVAYDLARSLSELAER